MIDQIGFQFCSDCHIHNTGKKKTNYTGNIPENLLLRYIVVTSAKTGDIILFWQRVQKAQIAVTFPFLTKSTESNSMYLFDKKYQKHRKHEPVSFWQKVQKAQKGRAPIFLTKSTKSAQSKGFYLFDKKYKKDKKEGLLSFWQKVRKAQIERPYLFLRISAKSKSYIFLYKVQKVQKASPVTFSQRVQKAQKGRACIFLTKSTISTNRCSLDLFENILKTRKKYEKHK